MALPKKYGKWHTIYMNFSRWAKNGIVAKAIASFFKTLMLETMKKQKLLNEDNSILFIDCAARGKFKYEQESR